MDFEAILNQVYFGNSVMDYLISAGIIVASFFILPIVAAIIKKVGNKSELVKTSVSKFFLPLSYVGIFYLSVNLLVIPPDIMKIINVLFLIAAIYFIVKFVNKIINHSINVYAERYKEKEDRIKLKPLTAFFNAAVWIIGVIFLFDNLGFDISTIIAGLGIGGIAIALAAQAVLGDLFSYFVIYFDKPFEEGDFIIFDDKLGMVENIGIKSTKIRALTGEQLVVSNSNLTNARLHNYKRMEKRRVVNKIGVTYDTGSEKLKQIPDIIKELILRNENASFDRSHFVSYGDSALIFETVFYVHSPDYVKYMDIQQQINLDLYEKFEELGIEFAFPTRTIYTVPVT